MALPIGKFELWTVTWISKDKGSMVMMEPDSKGEVLSLIEELSANGEDMAYVNVFPPGSNLTLSELMEYKEDN